MGNLTKNFSREEFRCKCCGKNEISMKLVEALQKLRTLAGVPIHINSAYRCAKHNKEVGGVAGSQHTKGLAADIRAEGIKPHDLAILAKSIPEFCRGGIGEYKSFVHVDVRGTKARWEGKY